VKSGIVKNWASQTREFSGLKKAEALVIIIHEIEPSPGKGGSWTTLCEFLLSNETTLLWIRQPLWLAAVS
jgi:hypothetical protein